MCGRQHPLGEMFVSRFPGFGNIYLQYHCSPGIYFAVFDWMPNSRIPYKKKNQSSRVNWIPCHLPSLHSKSQRWDKSSFLRLIQMDFSKGDASITPWASGNYAPWKPSANLFPSDVWPQQGETGTKALTLVLTSAKEGWWNSSWEQIKPTKPYLSSLYHLHF